MSVCSICGLPKCNTEDWYHKQEIAKHLGIPVKHKPRKESKQ